MNTETKTELIDTIAGTATALGKELFVRRADRKQMETRAEMEKEIAEARERAAQAGAETTNTRGQQPQVESTTPGVAEQDEPPEPAVPDSGIEVLMEKEHCDMCRAILEYVRDLDPERRAEGLADYGRMKRAMEYDETEEAVKEVVKNSDILREAMQKVM